MVCYWVILAFYFPTINKTILRLLMQNISPSPGLSDSFLKIWFLSDSYLPKFHLNPGTFLINRSNNYYYQWRYTFLLYYCFGLLWRIPLCHIFLRTTVWPPSLSISPRPLTYSASELMMSPTFSEEGVFTFLSVSFIWFPREKVKIATLILQLKNRKFTFPINVLF